MEKCIECGATANLIKITLSNFDGFCESTKHQDICRECNSQNTIATQVGLFIKLKDGLYYDNFGCYEKVRSRAQLERIYNREFYDLLKLIS